ncbi:NADPH-dependent FMN reductase [Seonamhaeicola sp. S2-3]|uniref:NADPH-dependent FMN reductase n=1 Tax=Seonamhaeicola sp. S2-3 TaxID=1936081 RepID=UPI0009728568|nr:NAD(P)H-dependent oxidoreductase [Seonamhaeicola sp. S2-3]APY12469.1 NADPH-dependent FMN reductase [Seonamhaeicola sp. S2-3]
MKKIIAFAGSSSKTSINKQLAVYAANLVEGVEVTVLDLNDYNLPLYGIDLENQKGIPDDAHKFFEQIQSSDGIVLSLAEHNGAYTTVFKNLFDWMSRINGKLWLDKPMLLMATSPGARGGASVLEIAKDRFPFNGGNIVAQFSLPSFNDNFKDGEIITEALKTSLISQVKEFQKAL